MKKITNLFAVLLILLFVTQAFSQEKEVKSENKKSLSEDLSNLGISGKVYLSYSHEFTDNISNLSIDRAYITFQRDLFGPISFKFRTDVKGDNNGYQPFIKAAYLQYKDKFSSIGVKAQAGMIGTPNIGVTGKMQDLRWIYQDYSFDKASDVIGETIDTSADMGALLSLSYEKLITLTGSVTEGAGYNDKGTNDDFKNRVIHSTLTISPIKQLMINGYFKTGDTKESGTDKNMYYGGGIGWKTKPIKAGFNVILPTVDDGTENKYLIAELWANANLKSFTGMPLLAIGRFAYGKHIDDNQIGSMKIGVGTGYKFNKYFRALLYYNFSKDNADGSAVEHVISIKTEAKF